MRMRDTKSCLSNDVSDKEHGIELESEVGVDSGESLSPS